MTNLDVFREDDQAGIIAMITAAHLKTHGGQVQYDCQWCQAFLAHAIEQGPFETYKFITFDISENKENE